MKLPDFEDVLRAREVVGRHLPRTPTWSYPTLSQELGCELFVKHENHLEGMLRCVDDFALVPESAIARAIRALLRHTHNLAEGAGAAPLAAIDGLRAQLSGKRVAMVLSGGNLDSETLRRVLASEI